MADFIFAVWRAYEQRAKACVYRVPSTASERVTLFDNTSITTARHVAGVQANDNKMLIGVFTRLRILLGMVMQRFNGMRL